MLNYNKYDIEWAEGFDEILEGLGGTPPDDDEVFDFMCETKIDIPSNAYYELVLSAIYSEIESQYPDAEVSYYVNARDTNLYINGEQVNDWEDARPLLTSLEIQVPFGTYTYEESDDPDAKMEDLNESEVKEFISDHNKDFGTNYKSVEEFNEGEEYREFTNTEFAKGGELKWSGTEKTRAFGELFEKANKKEIEQLLKKTKKGTIISIGRIDHQKLGNNKWSTPKTMEGSGYAKKYPLSLKRIATEKMLADMIYDDSGFVNGVPIKTQEVTFKVLITDDYDSRKENESKNPNYHNFDTNFYIREGFTKRYQDELAKYAKGGKVYTPEEMAELLKRKGWRFSDNTGVYEIATNLGYKWNGRHWVDENDNPYYAKGGSVEVEGRRKFKLTPIGDIAFVFNSKSRRKGKRILVSDVNTIWASKMDIDEKTEKQLQKAMREKGSDLLTDGTHYYTTMGSSIAQIEHPQFENELEHDRELGLIDFEKGGITIYAKGGVTKPRLKKGDVVELNARKWQDSNGNTYHNVQVYVNDDYIGSSGKEYGYGTQYESTANKMLFDKYNPPYGYDPSNNPIYMLKDKGIRVISNGDYVNRKRDMLNFAKGGKVKKKQNNEMLIGGITGILLGIFLNR